MIVVGDTEIPSSNTDTSADAAALLCNVLMVMMATK